MKLNDNIKGGFDMKKYMFFSLLFLAQDGECMHIAKRAPVERAPVIKHIRPIRPGSQYKENPSNKKLNETKKDEGCLARSCSEQCEGSEKEVFVHSYAKPVTDEFVSILASEASAGNVDQRQVSSSPKRSETSDTE